MLSRQVQVRRQGLNDPPTAVGGIRRRRARLITRKSPQEDRCKSLTANNLYSIVCYVCFEALLMVVCCRSGECSDSRNLR